MAAVLAGATTLAIAPALASADPSPLTDDFTTGAPDANTWVVPPGVVREKLAYRAEDFNGASGLPSDLAMTQWTMGTGSAAVNGAGSLIVDGARVDDGTMAPALGAPETMEFRATFANMPLEHVGLGDTLDTGSWAIFSTGGGNLPTTGLYARTFDAAGGTFTDSPNLAPGIDPRLPHTYRIEWAPGVVTFYVDDVVVATHNTTAPTGLMRPVISDNPFDSSTLAVDWLTVGAPSAGGTFTSRALKSDNAKSVWGALTSTGNGVTFQTRSGNTSNPDDGTWSGFTPVTGGVIQSPSAQYIQYKATLAGTNAHLDSIHIAYSAPATGSSGAGGSGGSGSGGSGATTGTGQSSGGQGTKIADTSAPRVTFSVKSLRVSKKGTVGVKVGCPATETSCKITIDLKRGKTAVAHKTVTVAGGKTKNVTLQLNKAGRRQLGKAHTLKVSALITARDAAGNKKSSTKKLTLRG